VYSRIINGNEHTFGVSGKLIRNALVMYDRETDTYWSQLLGEAVEGSLVGTRLEHLPAIMTTWAEWKELHPDTRAIQKGYVGLSDPYEGYYLGTNTGVIPVSNSDDRLGNKEFVIGVEVDQQAVAYPFSVLNTEPVISDEIAGTEIVVAFDADAAAGAVWERTLEEGQVLDFVELRGVLMRDTQTGSLWDGLTGTALEGEYAGEVLKPVANTQVFWFAWVDFHPETGLYGLE
jgi:hypothetical protein